MSEADVDDDASNHAPDLPVALPPDIHLNDTIGQIRKRTLQRLAEHFGLDNTGNCQVLRQRVKNFILQHINHFINLPQYAVLFTATQRRNAAQPEPPPIPPPIPPIQNPAPDHAPQRPQRRPPYVLPSEQSTYQGFGDNEIEIRQPSPGRQFFPDIPNDQMMDVDGEGSDNEEEERTARRRAMRTPENDELRQPRCAGQALQPDPNNPFQDVPEGE